MSKKLYFHCVDCGNEAAIDKNEYSGSYDIACNECRENKWFTAPNNIKEFAHESCTYCSCDWYCPSYCDVLEKAEKMDFELIRKKYIQHEGDLTKVWRYIKNTKRY